MGDTFQKLQKAAEIPSDVAQKVPILTMTGFHEFIIENYRGILEYTSKLIRIQTKTGQIKINGIDLNIEYYTNEEMKVTGIISLIEFQAEKNGGIP
ncbi:MAG: YabP/YqfC family sporulation protein [Hespellia sp.]|nr:YabP/YqfC family sporulation protein [Hespellia sp.]